MKPGPELDALVVEKVMGCVVINYEWGIAKGRVCGCKDAKHDAGDPLARRFKPYSTDIAVAWEVWVHMQSKRGFCEMTLRQFSEGDGWEMRIGRAHDPESAHISFGYMKCWQGEGDEPKPKVSEAAPYAICLAALAAVGVDVSE